MMLFIELSPTGSLSGPCLLNVEQIASVSIAENKNADGWPTVIHMTDGNFWFVSESYEQARQLLKDALDGTL